MERTDKYSANDEDTAYNVLMRFLTKGVQGMDNTYLRGFSLLALPSSGTVISRQINTLSVWFIDNKITNKITFWFIDFVRHHQILGS